MADSGISPGRTHSSARQFLERLLWATILTALIMAAAIASMFLTTEPRLLNLLVEPFSLLLMPGLLGTLAVAGAHDYSPRMVVYLSTGFYFVSIYLAVWWRQTERRRTSTR
jgi:vacuolar-type H+-ATPase subunit I/STV1